MHRFQNYMSFQYRCPLSNGAVIPSYVIPEAQTEARAETSLASFCPQFGLKSQYEHPNIIAQIIFSISILTCIHIYGASICRGENEANILLFSRNFYSSETHT